MRPMPIRVFLFFLLLYCPPILPFPRHMVGLIGWTYLFWNFKKKYPRDFVRHMFLIVTAFILYIIYLSGVSIINGNSLTVSSFYLYWIIDFIPACIALTSYLYTENYTQIDILTDILIAGCFEAIVCLLAYLVKPIQNMLNAQMISNGIYDAGIVQLVHHYRLYGYSMGLFFDMPILQMVLACIAGYLALRVKTKYIVCFPLLALSALINARVSIIVFVAGFLLLFANIFILKYRRQWNVVMILIFTTFLGVLFLVNTLQANGFITDGFKQLYAFFSGNSNKISTVNVLFSRDFWKLPLEGGLLFGRGLRIMGGNNQYNVLSDIGYVNDIWMGGLLYVITIYSLFVHFLWVIFCSHKFAKKLYLFIFLMIVLFVTNIKGEIFSPNCVTVFIVFLYVYKIRSVKHNSGLRTPKKELSDVN